MSISPALISTLSSTSLAPPQRMAAEPPPAADDRFVRIVLDPGFNALHIAMLQAAGAGWAAPAEGAASKSLFANLFKKR